MIEWDSLPELFFHNLFDKRIKITVALCFVVEKQFSWYRVDLCFILPSNLTEIPIKFDRQFSFVLEIGNTNTIYTNTI